MSEVHEVKLGDIFFVPYLGGENGISMFIATEGGWGAFNPNIQHDLDKYTRVSDIHWSGVRYVGNILDFFKTMASSLEKEHLGELIDKVSEWPVDKK